MVEAQLSPGNVSQKKKIHEKIVSIRNKLDKISIELSDIRSILVSLEEVALN